MGRFLIFGGTGGIGGAISKQLITNGHSVIVAARTQSKLESLKAELEVYTCACDVTQEDSVANAFSNAEQVGPIDGVALCVGSILLKPAHLTSTAEWLETINLNLTSAFLIVRQAARSMKSGAVLLFSSGAAQIGLANHEAIAAAKAGIEGLVRAAATTYASRGLRFNAIAPGLVRTELSAKIFSSPAAEKASLALHGLNRLGEPSDIAQLACWLLGSESSWVSGQVFNVDGGLARMKKLPNP